MNGELILKGEERVSFALRSLFRSSGYAQFRMSRFEEYELYVRNKDFLISDNIITFTDTSGKLMALKPDVTLSIIKSCHNAPGTVQRLFYDENVYRVSRQTHSFKELRQVGLECIGAVDDYCLYEVLMLACRALREISPECTLEVSDMGLLNELFDSLNIDPQTKNSLLRCISEKNAHELGALCRENGMNNADIELLQQLTALYGRASEVIEKLRVLLDGRVSAQAVDRLAKVFAQLEKAGLGGGVNIDFSVTNDLNYYSGIVFNGFINGVPNSVLSGGQYDKLMRKMGKSASAIGFAVYLDSLERFFPAAAENDSDVLVLYDDGTALEELISTVEALRQSGKSLSAQRVMTEDYRCGEIIDLRKGAAQNADT